MPGPEEGLSRLHALGPGLLDTQRGSQRAAGLLAQAPEEGAHVVSAPRSPERCVLPPLTDA